MILFLTGVPGSGKTYFAVNYLFDTFINKKSKHFGESKRFIANINGFNYETFGKIGRELDYDRLYSQLNHLFLLKENGADDNELLVVAQDFEIDKALFIIDECHSFFDKDNKVLVWWLSYHRHLYHNILLITQNLGLVNKKYCSFSEFFYSAQASSLRIFSSVFRYKVFTDSRLYKKTEVKGFTLKFNPQVYSLYHSGQNEQPRKVIFYYLAIALLFFFLTFLIFLIVPKVWGAGQIEEKPKERAQPAFSSSVSSFPKVYIVICRINECFLDGHRFSYLQLKQHFSRSILHTIAKEDYDQHFVIIEDHKKYLLGVK
ncbi:MAG: zonular occludens toxin domain-containing protein [Helicobacteraceae bacterium]|jgi:zona occludens toxin|nr:zonular occludens toxin domain-containing protein [Helicobacteraceae bacterium]